MTPVLRRAIPVLMAATALMMNTGCGSKSSERSPTSPTGPQAAAGNDAAGIRTTSAVAPPLGSAGTFGVVGASTVTNTGPTVVNGDLGISPGSALTGFPPGSVTGTIHLADATALAAQNSITTAYNSLAGQACDTNLTGQNLGGLTLTPGTYCFSTSAQLTGTLTLNALGSPGAVWVFQMGSTLTTASGAQVAFINGGQACGAFWQAGSSVTIGSGTAFSGNVFAQASITLNTGASSAGALFARTGAVTLDNNSVAVVGSCGGPQPTPTPGPTPPPVPALPEAAMLGLVAILLASGYFVLGRR